jgi:serine/threonine protein kinase
VEPSALLDLADVQVLLSSPPYIAKVADFGLSIDAEPFPEKAAVCGTAGYIAPEVYKSKRHSAASDIWAFGCIVYFLASEGDAISGSTFLKVEASVKQLGKAAFRKTYSKELVELIDSCLNLNPEGRPTTASLHHYLSQKMKMMVLVNETQKLALIEKDKEKQRGAVVADVAERSRQIKATALMNQLGIETKRCVATTAKGNPCKNLISLAIRKELDMLVLTLTNKVHVKKLVRLVSCAKHKSEKLIIAQTDTWLVKLESLEQKG